MSGYKNATSQIKTVPHWSLLFQQDGKTFTFIHLADAFILSDLQLLDLLSPNTCSHHNFDYGISK